MRVTDLGEPVFSRSMILGYAGSRAPSSPIRIYIGDEKIIINS